MFVSSLCGCEATIELNSLVFTRFYFSSDDFVTFLIPPIDRQKTQRIGHEFKSAQPRRPPHHVNTDKVRTDILVSIYYSWSIASALHEINELVNRNRYDRRRYRMAQSTQVSENTWNDVTLRPAARSSVPVDANRSGPFAFAIFRMDSDTGQRRYEMRK